MTMKKDFTFHALIVVLIITFITYYPSINNGFTTWDDQGYVTLNQHLKNNAISDFFTKDKFVMGNYHPLTMITYAIEYSIAGLNPQQYHIDNFILHLLNTGLVFWFIFLLGGWQIAALVAMLFGIHPMHVESVAWISERKDVLYTFFYLAALISYVRYFKSRKKIFYAITLLFFLLSLLSKGQAVTLPIALVLIDYYFLKSINKYTFLNKIPFFVLSMLFGMIAFYAQRSANVFSSPITTANQIITDQTNLFYKVGHFVFIFYERICYASYGFIMYIIKLLLPFNLSCFYPYPDKVNGLLPVIFYLMPLVLLALVLLFFIKWRKNNRVVFGFCLFVFCITPVLQLLPVGSSIVSDRYTYLPSIGLFFIMAHIILHFSGYKFEDGKWNQNNFLNKRILVLSLVLLVFTSYSIAAYKQCKVWKDSETLFTHVLEKYPDVYYIQYKLGYVYLNKGESCVAENKNILSNFYFQKAIQCFTKSVSLNAKFSQAWQALAFSYINIDKPDLALNNMNIAIGLTPNSAILYTLRAEIYRQLKDVNSAIIDEQKANRLNILKCGN